MFYAMDAANEGELHKTMCKNQKWAYPYLSSTLECLDFIAGVSSCPWLPVDVYQGRQLVMIQITRFLQPTLKTWMLSKHSAWPVLAIAEISAE